MTKGADDIEIGSISPEDFERWHDLRRQAFGGTTAFDAAQYETFAPERVRGAKLDGDLVAVVVTVAYEQTWGGVAVPCGGVAGVSVAPEARGRGVARRLMAGHLHDMYDRGEVVSALYPTTATLYRSLGYEVAGHYVERALPHATVPTATAGQLRWQRVGFGDERLVAVHHRCARQHSGWLSVPEDRWQAYAARWTAEPTTNRYAYVGWRGDEPVAAVVYHYAKPARRDDVAMYELQAEVLVAVDPGAWRSVLGFLAQQSTTSTEVRTTVPVAVIAPYLPHLQRSRVLSSWPWMLRLVDVAGAFAARPAPISVTGRVALSITDNVLAANRGDWVLEVGDGKAALTRGGDGAVEVSIQTLAQIYAGADVATLAASGLLPGANRDDVDLLSATFPGTPDLQFFF